MKDFRDKIAVVTGGGSGIGLGIARALAGEGAQVVIADLDEAAGRELAGTLPGARFLRLDVTAEPDWLAALATIERDLGPLDILVNNAGYNRPNVPLDEMELALWQRHFAVNSDGPFLGCRIVKGAAGGAMHNFG